MPARPASATHFLPGQGKKLFAKTIEETLSKNKELISFLHGNLRQQMHELNLALKVRGSGHG